jgi:hypothetical protein
MTEIEPKTIAVYVFISVHFKRPVRDVLGRNVGWTENFAYLTTTTQVPDPASSSGLCVNCSVSARTW